MIANPAKFHLMSFYVNKSEYLVSQQTMGIITGVTL